MDEYVATYCDRCHQLQWASFIGKPCQFCGHLQFIVERPAPTFSLSDRRLLRSMKILEKDK